MTPRIVVSLLAAAALTSTLVFATAGCATDPTRGYTAAGIYPENYATIAIPIIENRTFVRDVEFELTDALIKEIQARTPYRIASEASADTVFTSQIRRVELEQLSKSRDTGLGEEVVLSVTIDFEWRDLREDRAILIRKSFSGHGLFTPSAPASERIELGRAAVVEQLARDIVDEMRGQW